MSSAKPINSPTKQTSKSSQEEFNHLTRQPISIKG